MRTLAKIEHTCYSKRTLRYQAGDQEQDVTHFWFTAWPDHDVPVNPDGTIGTNETVNFLDAVRTHRSICQDKSPLLVHCSAGIGRTGTLLVIDHAMDAINVSNSKFAVFFSISQCLVNEVMKRSSCKDIAVKQRSSDCLILCASPQSFQTKYD